MVFLVPGTVSKKRARVPSDYVVDSQMGKYEDITGTNSTPLHMATRTYLVSTNSGTDQKREMN